MPSIKNEDIQRIIDLVKTNDIEELEIQNDKQVIRVRASSQPRHAHTPITVEPSSAPSPTAASTTQTLPSVNAPLVGTIYLTPSPEQNPFVEVGSHVKKGQTLCLIEAMKTFNHIQAPHDGTVMEICIRNGQTVEFEQPLFLLSDH